MKAGRRAFMTSAHSIRLPHLRGPLKIVKDAVRKPLFRVVEAWYLRLAPEGHGSPVAGHQDIDPCAPQPATYSRVNWADQRLVDIDEEHDFDGKVAAFLDLEVENRAERNWLLPS